MRASIPCVGLCVGLVGWLSFSRAAVPPAPAAPAATAPATTPFCPPSATVARPPLRKVPPPPLDDDLPLPPLLNALAQQVARLAETPDPLPGRDLLLPGPPGRRLSAAERREGLQRFLTLAKAAKTPAALWKAVIKHFDFYRAEFPGPEPGVLITGYYEPILAASAVKTARLSQPLYREPPDLVTVDLGRFDERFAGERPLRGRVVNGRLVPYRTREEIDGPYPTGTSPPLPSSLVLAYVDPVDAYLLQTEGSGLLRFPGGKETHLLFANHNGQPHTRLGPFLPATPPGTPKLSMEETLRHLAPRERQQLFNKNPRYVFFKPAGTDNSNTTLGVPALAGRTIATDNDCFPKGGLAYLTGMKPRLSGTGKATFVPMRRLVLDQDTGGAILGPRVDLFFGRGEEPKRQAGVLKQRGELYFLLPKAPAPTKEPPTSR